MKRHLESRSLMRALRTTGIMLFGVLSASEVRAQTATGTKKVLSVSDYTRWRSIDAAQISGDGKWVSYGYRFTNTPAADAKPVLHIMNLATNQVVDVPNATQAQFSANSRWIVYQIDVPGAAGGGRGGRGGGQGGAPPGGAPPATPPDSATPPAGRGASAAPALPPRRFELRELATGKVQAWQDMQSATFSPTSTHLLLRRRPAGAAGPGATAGAGPAAAATNPTAPRGTDAILHDLNTRRSQFFGSVGEIAFNRKGDLLAYTVEATPRDGNGIFALDLKTGRTTVLENDARTYARLTWNDDGSALAILKGRDVEKMRERENTLLVYSDVRSAFDDPPEYAPARLDPATATGFPKGWVISDRGGLTFSDDNKRVFFGVMAQGPAADTTRRRSADSVADVDVWRTQDERIQSVQMTRATADRNFSFRSAFDVAASKYVPLADSTMRDIEIAPDGRWAVGRDTRAYTSDYGPTRADIYRVNTSTGERTLMLKGQYAGQHVFGIAPSGNSFLYWKDNKFQSYNFDTGTSTTLGGATAPAFIDVEFDNPGPKPSYGIAGYTNDGQGVVVMDHFDLWLLPLDGTTSARNLTGGAGTKDNIHFRYVRTEAADPLEGRAAARRGIDLSKPVTLSAFGEFTKKSGFYELSGGNLKELVYEDASFSTPTKAAKADTYLFTRQTFSEFPDLRISGAGFRDAKKITDANPQQSEYVWGHRMLFDFKTKSGNKLQGMLALPDDYKAGEKRPMLVTFYEKNTQNLNRYTAPSYITGMGTSPIEAVSRGYITMIPDVFFHTGTSHTDMLEAVEAATKRVIELGYADPKRVGVHGHSYGGEGAAFIGTMSKMFAAVGVGAGVTDLFSDFSQSWGWSYQVSGGSGANGSDYYLYGQGRWGFSPWEKPDVYHYQSALTHAPETVAPILIMHGTADPTVAFSEGMNFYSALRYNKKNAVLLAYPGEGHGLSGLANRKDLTTRFFQFFDHYLKDSPAPKWMTDGVPYLVKDTVKDPR